MKRIRNKNSSIKEDSVPYSNNLQVGFTGFWIPSFIALSSKLTPTEKILLAIFKHAGEEGCPNNFSDMASFIGCSTSKLYKIIYGLEEKRFIKIIKVESGVKIEWL